MARPPATPPSSDLDGVDEDRRPIDHPANSGADKQAQRQREVDEAKGRPPGGRA